MSGMCGGTSGSRPASDEIQQICDAVRQDLENKAGRKFTTYKALEVASQVVNGTNYFVKIDVGDNEFLHARIHQPLACYGTEPTLHSYQLGKTREDKLAHF